VTDTSDGEKTLYTGSACLLEVYL